MYSTVLSLSVQLDCQRHPIYKWRLSKHQVWKEEHVSETIGHFSVFCKNMTATVQTFSRKQGQEE